MKYTVLIDGRVHEVRPGANQTVEIDGEAHQVDFRMIEGSSLYSLLLDNRSYEVLVERAGDEFRISIGGEMYVASVKDERTRKIENALAKNPHASGEVTVRAPMPGLVRELSVQVGDQVTVGQGVVILEAMKMENELRAPRAGAVAELRVKPGDAVVQGQALLIIK